MYYHFLRGITTKTIFDLILSSSLMNILRLPFIPGFLNISPIQSKTKKKSFSQKTTKSYTGSQVIL